MAEIHVQQKRTSAWPWIIAALLVIGALALLFGRNGDRETVAFDSDTADVVDAPAAAERSAGAAAGGFTAWRASNPIENAMGREHEYIADGLREIADNIEELDTNDALQSQAESIRSSADALQEEQQSQRHSEMARQAFETVSSALSSLATGASGVAAQLEQAAGEIHPERPLMEQTEAVRTFFDRAEQALASARRSI